MCSVARDLAPKQKERKDHFSNSSLASFYSNYRIKRKSNTITMMWPSRITRKAAQGTSRYPKVPEGTSTQSKQLHKAMSASSTTEQLK